MIHHIAAIVKKLQRIERKLPHLQCIPENFDAIEQYGMQTWLDQQKQHWTCPQCQATVTWYQQQCEQCGATLESFFQ
jgi:hypothetical protein